VYVLTGAAAGAPVLAGETRMSDAGAVRASWTATHREGDVEPRVVAMRDFLANATNAELARNRRLIESQIEAVATQQARTAAHMLVDVLARDTQGRYPRAIDAVLRWWAVQPDDGFRHTWDLLDGALDTGPRTLERALLDVLGGLDPRAPTVRWRVHATTRVLERLEERFDHPSRHPEHDLWRLLLVVRPPGAPTARADWVCVMGDRAAARGDQDEARACYRLAFEQGCGAAAGRLAHRLAVEGHRASTAGDAARAVRFLYEAAMLDPGHTEYATLHAAAIAARDGTTAAMPPDSAAGLIGDAAALLRAGDEAAATRLLRRGLDAIADDAGAWAVRLVLGALEGDDATLVDAARELLRLHGARWARCTPLGPGLVLHRVTRADPELAAAMLDNLPAELRSGRLADAVREAAAYRILASGVRALGMGKPDLARTLADRAERLLAADGDGGGVR